MKKTGLLLMAFAFLSCRRQTDEKTDKLDSLRSAYAGKEVHITLNNNQSGTEPLTSQYAYTDENKSDLAFKLETDGKYIMDSSEDIYIETTANIGQPRTDMVRIQSLNGSSYHKYGYVPYTYIWEITNALPYASN